MFSKSQEYQKQKIKRILTIISFLVLPILVYLAFVIGPALYSMVYSFTDWSGVGSSFSWVGFENYITAFNSGPFFNALKNNAIWVGIFITVPTGLGLTLAKMVDSLKGERFLKTIFYIPMTFSYVVIGLMWSWIYLPESGILNMALDFVGFGFLKTAWLSEPSTALIAVIIAAVWRQTGLSMVLYLAGLRGLPIEVIEQAKIDGASSWQRFWKVTFPMLKSTTTVVLSLTMIYALRAFAIVYVMTSGGPNRASDVLGTLVYKQLFWNLRAGYGSALAMILFVIILVVVVLFQWRMLSKEVSF